MSIFALKSEYHRNIATIGELMRIREDMAIELDERARHVETLRRQIIAKRAIETKPLIKMEIV